MRSDAELDSGGAEDGAKDAVIRVAPFLLHLSAEDNQCVHLHHRFVYQRLGFDSCGLVPRLDISVDLPLTALRHNSEVCNLGDDGIDELDEGPLAEKEDVLSWRTPVESEVVVGLLGSDQDVAARQVQEPIAAPTLGEVQGHSPLGVWSGLGGDAKSEGGGEGVDDVYKRVQVVDGFEKPRTGLAPVVGFAVFNVDVGDATLLQEGKNYQSGVVASRGLSVPGDAGPDSDKADDWLLGQGLSRAFIVVLIVRGRVVGLGILEANDVEGREVDLHIPVSSFYGTIDAFEVTLWASMASTTSFHRPSFQSCANACPNTGQSCL